jgi:hypothetical protein
MKIRTPNSSLSLLLLPAFAGLFTAFACSSSSAPKTDNGGNAGDAGSIAEAAGAGGSSPSTGGVGGNGGGRAGGSGTGTGEAGDNSGGADNAGGDMGAAGIPGAGGVPGVGHVLGKLPDITGPTKINQTPIVIPKKYIVASPNSVSAISSDATGNVVAATDQYGGAIDHIEKYGPDLANLWIKPLSYLPTSLVVDDAGDIFLGGGTAKAFPGETQTGSDDAFVTKLDSTGTAVWAHQWGATGGQTSDFLALGPGGAIIALGRCSGQVPGNPPTNKGGPFVVRYESDGTRTWLKQYPNEQMEATYSALDGLFVDPTGAVYSTISVSKPLPSTGYLRTIDPSGGLVSDKAISDGTSPVDFGGSANKAGGVAALGPAKDTIYDVPSAAYQPALAAVGLDGTLLWWRLNSTQTAVIDNVEGVTWTGTFSYTSSLVTTSDSVYIAGIYQNSYMNGSTAHPTTKPAFVGRFDLTGNQIWFTEFQVEPLVGDVPAAAPGNPRIAADANGNIVVATSGNNWSLFKLAKADGSLL